MQQIFFHASDLLIGLWRGDKDILDEAIPNANKFVHGKRLQWGRAVIAYLLGLYQLAAYTWDKELFQQLPMPNHKSFSKEYAAWRNTQTIQPT
ncbi:hypothetical protein [Eisenbergiella sp.]